MPKKPRDLVELLDAKADEIDRAVSRDKDDRESGVFNEIELLREAAAEIAALRTVNSVSKLQDFNIRVLWEIQERIGAEIERRKKEAA